MDTTVLDQIIDKYENPENNILAILHDAQNECDGLHREEARYLAKRLKIPFAQIHEMLNRESRAKLLARIPGAPRPEEGPIRKPAPKPKADKTDTTEE